MKFVSLSQLLGCPYLDLTLVFLQFQVLLSHLGGLKKKIIVKNKKKDGRGKRYKGRERRSRTRKQEREEEGVKIKKK